MMFKKEYIEPNEGFSQTVVVKTGNFKTLYISGQIGDGINLEAQTITTFQNLEKQRYSALSSAVNSRLDIKVQTNF